MAEQPVIEHVRVLEQVTPNRPQRTIAFAGDWHGDDLWAVTRLTGLGSEGIEVLLHAGDFGIWPGPQGKRYLDVVEKAAAKYGMTILITPGNHEDWDRIERTKAEDRGDGWGAVKWLRPHVGVLPRGHRFRIEVADDQGKGIGVFRSFVSLGGAPSIDVHLRLPGRDWWAAEQIKADDVERTAAGGHADVMIAHDSPDRPYAVPLVDEIIHGPSSWPIDSLDYARVGRERMHDSYMAVEPRVFVHGHYHVTGRAVVEHRGLTKDQPGGNVDSRGLVIALDQNRSPGNIARLDLMSLRVE